MKILVPDYYDKFKCIAGDCEHSCCVGWEIDIDEESLRRFHAMDGEIGARMAANIEYGTDGAFFRLDENERCPFLNGDGLCDLILRLGEDSLCQICSDHPRFRNFFSDHEEMGLGLCCEAAARLILTHDTKTHWQIFHSDNVKETPSEDEAALIQLRDELTQAMQRRDLSIEARLEHVLRLACLPVLHFDIQAWAQFLLGLEHLDEAWTDRLRKLQSTADLLLPCAPELDLPFEQLAVYLFNRHLPGALEDDDPRGRIAFVALILRLINALCALELRENGKLTLEDLVEITRMYSSEIEYSDENLYAILDELHCQFPEIDA